jgi:hypothetical protein
MDVWIIEYSPIGEGNWKPWLCDGHQVYDSKLKAEAAAQSLTSLCNEYQAAKYAREEVPQTYVFEKGDYPNEEAILTLKGIPSDAVAIDIAQQLGVSYCWAFTENTNPRGVWKPDRT